MILELSEITQKLSAKIDLNEEKIEKFTKKLQDFFDILENRIEIADKTEILEILSMLTTFKENFISKSKWEALVLRSLEIIRQNLHDSIYHPFSTYSGIGHVAFILNQLYEKNPNIKRFLYSVNELLSANLQRYLRDSQIPELSTINNFEFIYGLSGALRYTLDFDDDENMHSISSQIVEVLLKRLHPKSIDGHIIPGWYYYPSPIELESLNESAKNGVLNYGLSHGIAGPLMTLSLAYNKGICIAGLKESIDNIFIEYYKASYRVDDVIHWAGSISINQYLGQEKIDTIPRRMSWCYGSIGILRAMYLASIYMSNEENRFFAVNELVKIAKMEPNDYQLSMPIICHGFAGTASIMAEMYIDTENDVFQNMAKKQIIKCVDYIIGADYLYEEENSKRKVELFCYLEGYSGILQTIQSFLKCGDNVHKKRIIII